MKIMCLGEHKPIQKPYLEIMVLCSMIVKMLVLETE